MKDQSIRPPKSVCVVLTERCNAKCIYCPYFNKILTFGDDPPADLLLHIIRESAKCGVSELRFSGGEPLLRKDLNVFIEESTRLGIISTLSTNGTLLSEHKLDELAVAGINAIALSVDSLTPQTYEYCRGLPFSSVSQSLKNMLHFKTISDSIWFGVTVVITKYNIEELPSITRSLSEVCIPVQFQPCHNFSPQKENDHLFPKIFQVERSINTLLCLLEEGFLINNSVEYLTGIPSFFENSHPLQSYNCQIPWDTAVFDGNLNLRPCCFMEPAINFSTVNSLTQVWNSLEMHKGREMIVQDKCPGCWLLYMDRWK